MQRLADPTTAFDQKTNPYLTVDWLPIDLTVFNGDDRIPEDWPEDQEWLTSEEQGIPQEVRFASRERGLNAENIWRAFSLYAQLHQSKYGGDFFRPAKQFSCGRQSRRFDRF